MLSLKKYLRGPWELVRDSLISDLDEIESAINTNWSSVFTKNNVLKASAFDISLIPDTPRDTGSKLYLHDRYGGL